MDRVAAGVHHRLIDQREVTGTRVPAVVRQGELEIETVLRDVPNGEGVIDLEIWVEAVRSTGYAGWWAAETFSRKMQQQPPAKIASEMRTLLVRLLGPRN
jgi:L-ribulose-5-phosphate 3-epimerase UlaE